MLIELLSPPVQLSAVCPLPWLPSRLVPKTLASALAWDRVPAAKFTLVLSALVVSKDSLGSKASGCNES